MSSNHCRTLKFPDTNYSDIQTLRYRRRHTCAQLTATQSTTSLEGQTHVEALWGKVDPPPSSFLHALDFTYMSDSGR